MENLRSQIPSAKPLPLLFAAVKNRKSTNFSQKSKATPSLSNRFRKGLKTGHLYIIKSDTKKDPIQEILKKPNPRIQEKTKSKDPFKDHRPSIQKTRSKPRKAEPFLILNS